MFGNLSEKKQSRVVPCGVTYLDLGVVIKKRKLLNKE